MGSLTRPQWCFLWRGLHFIIHPRAENDHNKNKWGRWEVEGGRCNGKDNYFQVGRSGRNNPSSLEARNLSKGIIWEIRYQHKNENVDVDVDVINSVENVANLNVFLRAVLFV
jgi:hypothetical protein